jgi:hypothetical protein
MCGHDILVDGLLAVLSSASVSVPTCSECSTVIRDGIAIYEHNSLKHSYSDSVLYDKRFIIISVLPGWFRVVLKLGERAPQLFPPVQTSIGEEKERRRESL